MNLQDITVLEWTFSPADYLESPADVSHGNYQLIILDGTVEARMETAVYEANPAIQNEIEGALNHRFRGVELLSHTGYQLTYAHRHRVDQEGHQHLVVTPGTATVTVTARIADIIQKDAQGNVIYDSRSERMNEKRELANLAEKHGTSDSVARSLLGSYHAAVTDPYDELVHLYEIREALAKEFGGETRVRTELGISQAAWSELGRLADNEPIKQGRHRGRFPGKLRDATDVELSSAREIARDLIVAYLKCLDRRSS